MERDAAHWLYRFTAAEWLAASRAELARARDAITSGERRKGLFEARRAAGMGCNAFLVVAYEERFGRSYMDHLQSLAGDPGSPPAVREAALRLLEKAPSGGSVLVALRGLTSPADLVPADAAEVIIEHAAALCVAAATPN